jgi:hypothetical protein
VSAHDLPVEADTVPLHLLDIDPPAPAAVGALVLQNEELQRHFATWLVALQPLLWKEMQHMAETGAPGSGIIDWEAVSRVVNLDEAVRFLPPEHVMQVLGIQRAIEAVGLPRVIEALGPEKLLQELLKRLPPEKVEEMLRRQQQSGGEDKSGG